MAPPGRFSTITLFPRYDAIEGASIRVTMSLEFPAVSATTSLIGRSGKDCARAALASDGSMTTALVTFRNRRREGLMPLSHSSFFVNKSVVAQLTRAAAWQPEIFEERSGFVSVPEGGQGRL